MNFKRKIKKFITNNTEIPKVKKMMKIKKINHTILSDN